MTSQAVLESIVNSLVTAGIYKNEEAAIRALAVELIERKISTYQDQVQTFEKRYQHTLDQHTAMLKETASMQQEDEWMEWKGAAVMLEAWQQALQDVLDSAH